MKHLQERMLDRLVSYFASLEDVLGLLLFGSLLTPERHSDEWSDVDVLVVVKDGSIDKFFPNVEWLSSFGSLYTYSQSSGDFKYTTRACFDDFNRIDFVFTTEESLSKVQQWNHVPFFKGTKILVSRSKTVDKIASREHFQYSMPQITEEQFLELVNNFRFKATLAVYKVVRNDLLIAAHLSQDLVRDCCVLSMMLRDRSTGTHIHRQGGMGNPWVATLESTHKPFTRIGILDSIRASNKIFEELAHTWSSDYQAKGHLLDDWIGKAKDEVSQ